MNAIEFLINEHKSVKKTLEDISDSSHRFETKQKMFANLCANLLRHEKMEHTVWYPHFKDSDKLDNTVKHLLIEEKSAENAIKAFDSIKTPEEWHIKFSKFKKDVVHHAQEEERDLFPQVKKILDEEQLNQIGRDMSEFKKQYQ